MNINAMTPALWSCVVNWIFPNSLNPIPFSDNRWRYVWALALGMGVIIIAQFSQLWLRWDDVSMTITLGGITIDQSHLRFGPTPRADLIDHANLFYNYVICAIEALVIGVIAVWFGWKIFYNQICSTVFCQTVFQNLKKIWPVVFGCLVLFICVALLVELRRKGGMDSKVTPFDNHHTPTNVFFVMLLPTCILGPLFEEIIVRFIMYQCLRSFMKFFPAALLSGLVFGSLHWGYHDVVKIVGMVPVGIIFAWAYERTGSISAPIFIHMGNNTFWLMMTFLR